MMAERNAALPEAKRILYRVGVNLGDILIEGEDILGDGVNVAARLEGICEPGGVCLSSSAHEQVRGRIEAEFVDLGEQVVKNIAQPVRAYALTPTVIAIVKAVNPPTNGQSTWLVLTLARCRGRAYSRCGSCRRRLRLACKACARAAGYRLLCCPSRTWAAIPIKGISPTVSPTI
jgi:hypothetical protein